MNIKSVSSHRNFALLVAAVLILPASGCRMRSQSAGAQSTAKADGPAPASQAEEDALLPDFDPTNLTIEGPAEIAAAFATLDKQPPALPSTDKNPSGLALADQANEGFYFMIIWGFQGRGPLNLPRNAHTFATFVESNGEDLRTAQLKSFTMSWLPVDGIVRLIDNPKPGRWYGLQETRQLAPPNRYDLKRSPIYQVSAALYRDALVRYWDLDTRGRARTVLYLANDDMNGRTNALRKVPGGYTNCIHAISDAIAPSAGLLDTRTNRGWSASEAVLNYFRGAGHMPVPQTFDGLLAQRLGL